MRALPYDAFISYATEDEEFAAKIAKALEVTGFNVWFAPLNLRIGDRLLDSINAGLNLSETGLLLLSPTYIAKKWTSYELDVLHRQHIETDKRILPVWHGVTKGELDKWNPGLSAIVGLKTDGPFRPFIMKIVDELSGHAPLRGVAPSWESPYWRFLQGRGELNANTTDGATFNIFEAVEFPDNWFPIFFDGKGYSRSELLFNVAQIMAHQSYDTKLRLGEDVWERIKALCIDHGYNPDLMG